ncbi:unnamed protein product, partial [Ectocarpus fasciculatus]
MLSRPSMLLPLRLRQRRLHPAPPPPPPPPPRRRRRGSLVSGGRRLALGSYDACCGVLLVPLGRSHRRRRLRVVDALVLVEGELDSFLLLGLALLDQLERVRVEGREVGVAVVEAPVRRRGHRGQQHLLAKLRRHGLRVDRAPADNEHLVHLRGGSGREEGQSLGEAAGQEHVLGEAEGISGRRVAAQHDVAAARERAEALGDGLPGLAAHDHGVDLVGGGGAADRCGGGRAALEVGHVGGQAPGKRAVLADAEGAGGGGDDDDEGARGGGRGDRNR